MSYHLEMTDPQGKVWYIPRAYGFGVHALTDKTSEAETFATESFVQRYINNNIHCLNAFWSSERRHAELTKLHYEGWSFKAVEALSRSASHDRARGDL